MSGLSVFLVSFFFINCFGIAALYRYARVCAWVQRVAPTMAAIHSFFAADKIDSRGLLMPHEDISSEWWSLGLENIANKLPCVNGRFFGYAVTFALALLPFWFLFGLRLITQMIPGCQPMWPTSTQNLDLLLALLTVAVNLVLLFPAGLGIYGYYGCKRAFKHHDGAKALFMRVTDGGFMERTDRSIIKFAESNQYLKLAPRELRELSQGCCAQIKATKGLRGTGATVNFLAFIPCLFVYICFYAVINMTGLSISSLLDNAMGGLLLYIYFFLLLYLLRLFIWQFAYEHP